ncbi:MAG: 4Fe-4S binding protein [Desulfobacterales bacterium]|jgi:NAD-dependent dihydropyrimidine dehydrogenase PreA subunit|nr:4Fe-4S binding protein [Desulfobacteraceae bacterium]MBT7086283.1 4Fe-4S binding protein [Desulfobacterales bacterium]
MSRDLYVRLIDRLNKFEYEYPVVESYINMIQYIYPEEHALIAADFPETAKTAPELAKILGKDEKEMADMLESMANTGSLFVKKAEDGTPMYELLPFMPGYFDMAVIHSDDERAMNIYRLHEEVRKDHAESRLKMMEDNKGTEKSPMPILRTLTINEALPQDTKIFSFEELKSLVDEETSFAATKCLCRRMASVKGNPCQANVPEYSCLAFGDVAEYSIERGYGKKITKEECLETIDACAKSGAVHNSNNYTEKLQLLCNCCSCCCGALAVAREVGNGIVINSTNFAVNYDAESCTACGDCVEICPVDAMEMVGDAVSIKENFCMGCGNCVNTCEMNSLTMKRIGSDKPTLEGRKKVGFGF